MKKKIYLLVLSVFCVAFAHAEYVAPSEGIFRIINMEYGNAMMEDFIKRTVHCADIGADEDYDQMWILKASGSGYTIQNLFTQNYIQTGNNTNNVPYWTDKEADVFNIVENKKWDVVSYNIWDPALGSKGLHYSLDQGSVVRWGSEDNKKATEWRFEKVNISEEEIAKAQAEYIRLTGGDNIDDYQTILNEVFEDSACTTLKSAYANKSVETLRAELTDKLPTVLVDMVAKVKSGDWTEANESPLKPKWDSDYAKKFRVQLIEPHSIAGEITEWIGHQGHTNMDNPTGLYANKRGVLYIMVDGEIKEGAELWATWIEGHSKMPNYNNGYPNGIRLKSGLNIVPFGKDGSALYFNYLVHTYNRNAGRFEHKLSDFPDLKIHVEGGYINGYYNRVGDALYPADNDSTWVYYEERANLANITILGRYEILQFELNDVTHTETDKEGNKKTWSHRGLRALLPEELPQNLPENQRINTVVDAWDRIMLSEKMTLGLASKAEVDSMNLLFPRYDGNWENPTEMYNYEGYAEFCDSLKARGKCDYSEYYNHRGLAFGTRSGYMYGSWDHSGYHINTTPSIICGIATEKGAAWGPGHEIGHQHQASFTYNGLMEVTNNLFSNIAVWYMGLGTSRLNSSEGNLENVYKVFREGGDVFGPQGGHIWVNTQMYYRLWLYYHRAGNNTQFYPRLFELLRKNPLVKSNGGGTEMMLNEKTGEMEPAYFQYTEGKTTILQFYQLCCEAAQEDLTEFFRAYAFFDVMEDRWVGDYTNSKYNQTQEEIDEAIAAVKAKGYPINNKVLFINDATNDPTYGHDGKTRREFWDDQTERGENAEVGCYVDYLAKDTITGKYLYSLENLKVNIEGGDGAVGFAVYNNKGEIQAFSNNHSFILTKKVRNMIRTGESTLVAVTPEGDDVPVLNCIVKDSQENQLAALQEALRTAKSYLEKTDTTGIRIGYLIPDSVKDFSALVAKIDTIVIAKEDTTEHTYGEWYINLDAEIAKIQGSNLVRVPLIPYSYYSMNAVINDVAYYMDNANAGLRTVKNEEEEIAERLQWKIIAAETEDLVYIQHRATGNFISSINSGQRAKAETQDISKAAAFKLIPDAPGSYFIQSANNEDINLFNFVMNNNSYIYAGNQTDNYAKWNIELVDAMLDMPETSSDKMITIYNLLSTDNGEFAYCYLPNSPRNRGRIGTDIYDDTEDETYWFYFKQGSEEGKYIIYNFATRLPVTESNSALYANKETDTAPEFTIALNEQSTELIISATEGDWYMPEENTNSFVEISTEGTTGWKLQRSHTIDISNAPLTSLTIDKDKATLTEGDSIQLTVKTAPEYAANHTVTWSSSDETIATVDSTGKVKAIAPGSAIITATANDASGLKATCKLTVQKKESGIFNTAASSLSVQSLDGMVVIEGLTNGTIVNVYSIVGKQITAITATDGTTTIDTGLPKGSTVFLKIEESTIKVLIQ